MSDRQAVVIKVNTRRASRSSFLLVIASDNAPTNGLDIIETNAPSVRNIDVYLWVRLGSKPILSSSIVGSRGIMNAKSNSSKDRHYLTNVPHLCGAE